MEEKKRSASSFPYSFKEAIVSLCNDDEGCINVLQTIVIEIYYGGILI
jgi:hypothetical protein